MPTACHCRHPISYKHPTLASGCTNLHHGCCITCANGTHAAHFFTCASRKALSHAMMCGAGGVTLAYGSRLGYPKNATPRLHVLPCACHYVKPPALHNLWRGIAISYKLPRGMVIDHPACWPLWCATHCPPPVRAATRGAQGVPRCKR